ncbi:FAD binding domain-containing protein [Pseudokineococcus sp. 1T1Z-3]|uniref:FAD binding domain-containing protein n=1 Tax=Pseudokineococcus sp. 1T1Z-3 TaxID=3132745 RepID=UPI00309D5B25
MDLPTITSVVAARSRADLATVGPGTAVLAGGTWLYSVPQPDLTGLVDLMTLGWPALEVSSDGLVVAAICTVGELGALPAADVPADWRAHPLLRRCARSLLASPKVQRVATVGGNICCALPAGAMTSLAVALEGTALVWTPDGGERRVRVADLVVGDAVTTLAPGEVLRAVELPASALRSRTASRRVSLSRTGRTAAMVVGRVPAEESEGALVVSLTASVPRPVVLRFDVAPSAGELAAAVEGVAEGRADGGARVEPAEPVPWFDDVHGFPDWRRAMTLRLAEQVRAELAAPAPP